MNQYLDQLTRKITSSGVYSSSLANPAVKRRLEILRAGVNYIIKHDNLDGLKEALGKLGLNGNTEHWVKILEEAAPKIKKTHETLDSKVRNIRALHPDIIAEFLYQEKQEEIEKLPLA